MRLFFSLMMSVSYISVTSCQHAGSANPPAAISDTLPVMEQMTTVTTIIGSFRDFEYKVNTNGKIRSERERLLVAETEGVVRFSYAETGKKVTGGTLLIQIDTISAHYRLKRAELEKFNTEKEYESLLLGYENLLTDKSPEKAAEIRKKLKISSGLAGAEQTIEEIGYELTRAIIKAPFAGMLSDIKIQNGQAVKIGQELLRIYDPEDLLLEVRVLETDVALLKKGMQADVFPVSMPEAACKATVQEINPYIDDNGMALVKLRILPRGISATGLFPGMNCSAAIRVPVRKSLVLPKEAVVLRSGRTVVFTLENGKAQWNYVTTGRDNGKEVEILSGLDGGKEVIVSNNLQLIHDAPVAVDRRLSVKDKPGPGK